MAAISIDGTPMTALPSDADQINYDNSNSRLSDTQVQDAIDTLANDSSTFVGTTTQWDNLTTAQKKAYKYRLLTDDYTDASIGNLSALHTTDKSSVVGAVNEVKDGLTVQTLTLIFNTDAVTGAYVNAYRVGQMVFVEMEYNPVGGTLVTNTAILTGLPAPISPYWSIYDGYTTLKIDANGILKYWYPTDTTTLTRRNYSFSYIAA